jgi:hypothetical protein
MGIFNNIAAIAKGMSITFREMFKPTIVENYPDGPGPLKGAVFPGALSRTARVCSGMRTGWKSA